MTDARTGRLALGAALALLLAARSLHADVIQRGYVVWIEADEVYVDIGAVTGVAVGDPMRVARPISLRHPVSGKRVTDELPVGTLAVARVGDAMSMAPLAPGLAGAVAVGDVVEVLIADRDPAPAAPPPEPAPPAPPPEPLQEADPQTRAVLAAWERTAGQPIDARIAVWERFLDDQPDSPYAAAVRGQLETLHGLRAAYPPDAAAGGPRIAGIEHAAPRFATYGEPLGLAFALRRPEALVAAWIHFRRLGDETYRRADLARDGDGYLRVSLPGDAVLDPGLEYFVEAAPDTGVVGAAVGTASAPIAVDVSPPPVPELFVDRRLRSRVSVRTSYLDFGTFDDRAGDHRDRFWVFEADFLLRLRTHLYAVRSGFGVINGRGGFGDDTAPESAGFNYGYTELELRANAPLSLATRLIAGLGKDGLGLGVEARLRAGREDATNLSFAISSLEEVGFLSEIRMQWAVVPELPVGLGVAVTDRPTRGDLGVVLAADVGWGGWRGLQPTLRLSYQGRNLDHAGVGAGLGMVFDW